ncbi:hypothetical protein [Streptomyces sp. NPDC050982]|uniref:hypothetical protein n=1 Tax=Streptomyces sp. NPDC050982 TaxID=3154746 RepID=UPI00340DACE9
MSPATGLAIAVEARKTPSPADPERAGRGHAGGTGRAHAPAYATIDGDVWQIRSGDNR